MPRPAPERSRRRLLLAALAGVAVLPGRAIPGPQASVFRLVYAEHFPPYSERRGAQVEGVFVDIARELLERRLGLRVAHAAYPWARAQEQVRRGEADAFVSVPTAERLQYTVATRGWLTQGRLVMLARADDPERERLAGIRQTADLAGIPVGTYLGNDWAKSVLADVAVHAAPSRYAALQMLAAGRIRLLVDAEGSARAAVRAAGLERSIVELPHALDSSETHLCIGRHSALLAHLESIESALNSMAEDGTLRRLSRA